MGCNEGNHRTALHTANMESAAGNGADEAQACPRFDSPVRIRIISYQSKKHDPDGISAKAAIDGLVHTGILSDDSCEEVKEVAFESHLCEKGAERTIIEIEEIAGVEVLLTQPKRAR